MESNNLLQEAKIICHGARVLGRQRGVLTKQILQAANFDSLYWLELNCEMS